MTKQLLLTPIGQIFHDQKSTYLQLEPSYFDAMSGLAGFSHLQIIWWFDQAPSGNHPWIEEQPYRQGPKQLGTFATRSMVRPNPLALSCSGITHLDQASGRIYLDYLDAADQTPVLDLKPYTPSLDRVENPKVPAWCANWPKNVETSGSFDWGTVFGF
ncbi:hypothetical protein SDC9_135303 [bioreactor metagenome]|uniref:TsaA-like domain-containing protein n=1 Tax=bioreactor metagenome TaxID=1076179 RepID=A0A645DHY0_9ZZZZ